MDPSVDLKVNKSLLDPHFDGYKLSLDALPTYKMKINTGLDIVSLTDNQYSYQHVKSFGIHNHLTSDPWNPMTVYYVDQNWKLQKCLVQLENQVMPPESVFEIPDASNQHLVPERHNVTLHFPSQHWAVLADGAGKLFVIETQDRNQQHNWKVSYNGYALGEGQCFVLLYSTHRVAGESQYLDCLLLHIDKTDEQGQKGPGFVTILEWLTFSLDNNSGQWHLDRIRRFRSFSTPNYAALEHSGKALHVASDRPVKLIYDSLKPVEEVTEEELSKEADNALPAYTWHQDDEDITLTFTLPPAVSKSDISFSLSPQTLELGIKNGDELLKGMLHGHVDVGGSTWTIQDHRLELTLCKAEAHMWPVVVLGDTRGEMVADTEQVRQIHERLAQMVTNNQLADPSGENAPAYNTQGLEECDAFPDEASVIVRYDGEAHQITHQANLGSHQWLFNAKMEPEKMPSVCLRHDVDGILWQPREILDPKDCPWLHVGTFNAFGYVQASKQQKKFCCCPPDLSYVIICDCVRHIYIYRQPSAILSPLRNRKTGREVSAIAKQQVVSLESVDDIKGIQATNERLFVLAGKTLYVIKVNMETALA